MDYSHAGMIRFDSHRIRFGKITLKQYHLLVWNWCEPLVTLHINACRVKGLGKVLKKILSERSGL